MPDEHWLHQQWQSAWQGLGAQGDGKVLLDALLAAWLSPQRHYHTLQHLSECLQCFESLRGEAQHPHEVVMDIWFHDAVYDVRASDNEQRSADWAVSALTGAGVGPAAVQRVRDLIMATCHAAIPQGGDARLLVDIDLAILGSDAGRYAQFEEQVRAEYAWVFGPVFRYRRRAILQQFRLRQPLYATAHFRQQRELQARQNLTWAINRLNWKNILLGVADGV